MRVLHVGKYFPPEPGGIERFLDALSRAQAETGLYPAVLAHDRRRSGVSHEAQRAIFRCRSRGQLLFTPLAPTWLSWLGRAIREHQPDLLHLHLPNPAAFAALLLPAARSLPWVLHWHADVPLDAAHRGLRLAYPAYSLFEQSMLRRSAAVIATSGSYLQASHALRDHRPRCRVVPLALGPAPEPGIGCSWPSEGLRVLAVGRLSYYKGFDLLVRAVAMTEGVSLVIAGDGDQATTLRRLIERTGAAARITLSQQLDDAGIEASYQACDLLCLPSIDRAEAFGLVLLEAMRAGRPVLASRLPGSGMSEVVTDGESGLQFEPGDVDALAAGLRRLRDDPALRLKLGAQARMRFAQRYGLQPVVSAISDIYRECLADR